MDFVPAPRDLIIAIKSGSISNKESHRGQQFSSAQIDIERGGMTIERRHKLTGMTAARRR
jgi:hypothetical protein